MKKFWNKADETNEIFIYGEIVSESWLDSDVTAKSFADDLKSFGGKDVTLRINSGGGDVFAAVAISNVIKSYKGKVKCFIDGLAASAATIITCACDSVSIAKNALFMVHNPEVWLAGSFDEKEISKVQNSLNAVKSSIVTTYTEKTGKTEKEISKLLDAETWYTAEEAKENNFVDEISGEVETKIDNAKKILFVNSLQVDCQKFDFEKIKNKLEVQKMDDKSLLAKIKNLLGGETSPAVVEVKDDEKNFLNEVREKELSRIKNLSAMKTGNEIVDGIVDAGIIGGATVEEVKKYVDVVKNIQDKTPKVDTDKTARAIFDLIEDNLKSGAEGVTGSTPQESEEEKRTAQAKMLADFANKII